MNKIRSLFLSEKLKQIREAIMNNNKKRPKLDPEKLKQIPDEVNIASKIIKYHPEASAYEKVVREDCSDAMNELRKKIIKKLS